MAALRAARQASQARCRAPALLYPFNRFTKRNTTQRKKLPCGRGAAPLSRFRSAPLFPAREMFFFLPYILFGCTVFLLLRFTAVSCRVNTVSLRGRLGFCRIVRGFSRFQVIPFFNPLCYSVFVVEDNAIFCWLLLCSVAFCRDFGSYSCDFGYKKCLIFLLPLWYSAFIR